MDKRLQEIEARKVELRQMLQEDKKADLDAIETELRELQSEIKEIEKRQQLMSEAKALNVGKQSAKVVEKENRQAESEVEKRAKALKENRTVTTDATLLQTHQSDEINPRFNTISTLIDAVKIKPLAGGESYLAPYRTADAMADYTEEGVKYHESVPEFAYAEINKTKITNYAEVTEEVEKLPTANYVSEIEQEVLNGIKRKINQQILLGNGSAGQLAGIFSNAADALTGDADIEIEKINEDTLDEIAFSYGIEDVEGDATLILSKASLREFARLRTDLGTKVYDIVVRGNTGTIDGIPFIINNFADAHDEFIMAYGNLNNYEMAVFSDVDMQRSSDFKFDQGIVAYRGSVFVGGNVVMQDGFVRVKKKQ